MFDRGRSSTTRLIFTDDLHMKKIDVPSKFLCWSTRKVKIK